MIPPGKSISGCDIVARERNEVDLAICWSSSSNSDSENEQTENNYDVTNKLVLQEETLLIADYKYKQEKQVAH